jgi:hypothetical protein
VFLLVVEPELRMAEIWKHHNFGFASAVGKWLPPKSWKQLLFNVERHKQG